jgi:hypothetical protein
VKRKTLIGTALALVVGIVLVWALWTEDGPPPMHITHTGAGPSPTGLVPFTVENRTTNRMYVMLTQEKLTNDVWTTVSPMTGFNLTAPGEILHVFRPPNPTNVWRVAVHYYPNLRPPNNFATRLRQSANSFVHKHQLALFSRWVNPVKVRTIYGPKMFGYQPVEEK